MKYLSILLTLFIFASCSSDDDSVSDNNTQGPNANIETTIPGDYVITTFTVDGEDRSNDYNGFTFTYDGDGNVTAQNDILAEVGTWTYATTTTDGELMENLELFFNNQEPFTDLSREWDIDAAISTTIRLSGFNSMGDNARDVLVFTRQ